MTLLLFSWHATQRGLIARAMLLTTSRNRSTELATVAARILPGRMRPFQTGKYA